MSDGANLGDAGTWLVRGGGLTPQQLGDKSFVKQVTGLLTEASWALPILRDQENYEDGLQNLGIRTRMLTKVVRACLEERVALCGEGSFEEALVITACKTWEPPSAGSRSLMSPELDSTLEKVVDWVVEHDGETDPAAFNISLEEFLSKHDPKDCARQLLRGSSGRSVLFDGSNKPVPELIALLGAAVRGAFADRPLTAMGKQRLVGLVMHLEPSPYEDRLFFEQNMESLGLKSADVEQASKRIALKGDFSYIGSVDSLGPDEDFAVGNNDSDKILGMLGFEIDREAVAIQRGLGKVQLPPSEDVWVRMTRDSLHSTGARFQVALGGLRALAASQKHEINADNLGVLEKEDMWRRAGHFDLWWAGTAELGEESEACVKEVSLALQSGLDLNAGGPISLLLGGLLVRWFNHGIDDAVRRANEFGLSREDLEVAKAHLREDPSALAGMEMGVQYRACMERVLVLGVAGLREAECAGAENIYGAIRAHVLNSVELSPNAQWMVAPAMELAFSSRSGSTPRLLLDWIEDNDVRAAFLDCNPGVLSQAGPPIQLELAKVVLSSPGKGEDGFRWDSSTHAGAVTFLTEALDENIKVITDLGSDEAGIESRLRNVKREILKSPQDTNPAAEALFRGDVAYFRTELRRAGRTTRLKALANAGPPLAHRWSKQVNAAKILLTVPTFVVGFFLWASLWLTSVYWEGEAWGGGDLLDGAAGGESGVGRESGSATPESLGLLKTAQADGSTIWVQAGSVTQQAFAVLQRSFTPPELSESLAAHVSYEGARRYCKDYGNLILKVHPELFGAGDGDPVCRLPRLSELKGVESHHEFSSGGTEWVTSPKNPNLWNQKVGVFPEGQLAETSLGVGFRVVFEVE